MVSALPGPLGRQLLGDTSAPLGEGLPQEVQVSEDRREAAQDLIKQELGEFNLCGHALSAWCS